MISAPSPSSPDLPLADDFSMHDLHQEPGPPLGDKPRDLGDDTLGVCIRHAECVGFPNGCDGLHLLVVNILPTDAGLQFLL